MNTAKQMSCRQSLNTLSPSPLPLEGGEDKGEGVKSHRTLEIQSSIVTLVRKEDGFTLVEIILAIIIISIGVLGLVSAISFTTGKSINAEVVSTAQQLAQERMEELIAQKRNSGYSSLPVALGVYGPVTGFSGYERKEDICYVDASMNPVPPACDTTNNNGYKRITVSINYSGLPDLPSPVVSLVSVVTDVRE